MNIQSAYSSKKRVKEAISEITSQIDINDPKLVIVFSSSSYNSSEVAAEAKSAFANAEVFGCTTAGELVSGKMLNNSIVAMAFAKEAIDDVKIEVIENLDSNTNPQQAFASFSSYYGQNIAEMDFNEYLGLILVDGLSNAEETLMEKIGTKTNVYFVGGSAGDDLKFEKTFVHVNGKVYSNAAALALLKPDTKFDILKTQSFIPSHKKFTATKVDEASREIIELDNKPASEVYAAAVGRTVEEAAASFMTHPFGIMIGDEPFVRSPQQYNGKAIKFYCNIAEGTELRLLESKNIITDTQKDLSQKVSEFGNVSGILNFNCILRTLELQNKKQTEEYGKIFSAVPTVGFSTYGEEYIGHINQTSVIVIFK